MKPAASPSHTMCYFVHFEEVCFEITEGIMNIQETSNWKVDLVRTNI